MKTPRSTRPKPAEAQLRLVPPPPEVDEDSDYSDAMSAAGRFLGRRAHSELELRMKLRGFERATVDRVMERLRQVELLDDAAFAQAWVEERGHKKGRRALEAELRAKGVSGEDMSPALDSLAPAELDTATGLATRHLHRVARRPLRDQAAAISQMLMRRGFERDVAEEATRAVLPPEGWD